MLKINLGNNLALFFWATDEFLVKSEVMNFWTYIVIFIIFKWAGVLYFWAWHQNRSGILQGSTKYDYTELMNLIWPLLPNFDQSILLNSYTSREECSSKGGSQDGTCASGFGVCCTCESTMVKGIQEYKTDLVSLCSCFKLWRISFRKQHVHRTSKRYFSIFTLYP